MTKNIVSKSGSNHRSNNAKKIQNTTASTNNITHTETIVSITVQKASIDSKMLTPEQKRLASLMNDKIDVTEIEKKINKIIELTGASKDKAIVALHDCANELDKAIDMILEGDSINESEWKSQARKKKTKAVAVNNKEASESKTYVNGETKRNQTNKSRVGQKQGKNNGEKSNQNQIKKKSNKKEFRKSKENEHTNSKDDWETDNNDKLDEWVDTIKNNNYKSLKTKSSHERKDRSTGNRSSNFSSRNNERLGQSADRNLSNNRNSRNYLSKNLKNTAFPNSIDTWTNVTATSNNPTNTSIDYSQMTVGNWSDVAANEELNENEENNQWSENNQIDMKVFTANKEPIKEESKMPNLASIVSGVKSQNLPLKYSFQQQNAKLSPIRKRVLKPLKIVHPSGEEISLDLLKIEQSQPQRPNQQQTQQNKIDLAALLKSSQTTNQTSTKLQDQQINKLNRGNLPRNNDSNTYGAVLLQRLQQRVTSLRHQSGKPNLSEYVNDYSNQATDNIKNLVNIPSNSYDTQNTSLLDNQQNQSRTQTQHLSQQQIDHGNKHSNQRISNRRQTKIPETAVEMPISDHISSLNVQFGALDFNTENYLNNENNSTAFHEQLNNKKTKSIVQNQNESELNNTNLLNTVQENNYRNNSLESTDKQQQTSTSKDILQNMGQQVSDNILERKQTSNYNKSSLYNQQHNENINSYKNTYGNQNENHIYQSNYQTQNTNYGYGSSNQSGYSTVNNYSSNYNNSNQNHSSNSNNTTNNNTSNTSVSTQKLNLKDLDTSTTSSNNNNINTTSSSLGLVSNTTVTTNVLKNSLTATGKNNIQQPNVAAPNVAPLLGTPQYIMSQPGLSAFYPIYDVPMAGPGRDHSFGYNPNTQDVKYSRTDANDVNNVQSTQAPVTQTPNHQIFSQFPPHYGFFYTGVNMMTQGLYQTAAPFLPVQPPNPGPPSGNTHATSNSTGFPKGQNQGAYGSHSAYSSAYDPLSAAAQIQSQQDYNKQNYSGPNNNNQQQQQQQQTNNKQMSSGVVNDLSNNNMYTKSHAQLTKNYDKPGFQTGTPPPFGIVNAAAALGYNPNQYIPMLQPQSNPSILHHTLQGDANQNVNSSGVGSQRSLSQQQKNSASNAKNYYNWS